MDNPLYKVVYLLVYSLIFIGERVRTILVWIVRTIGYIFSGIFRTLFALGSNFLRLLPRPKIPQLYSLKWFLLGVIFASLFVFLPIVLVSWFNQLPNPRTLSYMKFPATTKFYDRDGKLLYELYAEIDRQPIKLNEIPQTIVDATIAIEDQEFYHHLGFSPRGIARASRETFLKNNIQGGSTITQQLIKNTLLTPEPTLKRKVKELILAFWAERIYTKDEILEMYLNNVPYGGTAWGIKAASQKYFGKSVEDINLSEAAFLAGLPAAPTTYSPYGAHPELAIERRNLVLGKMNELGSITNQEEDDARLQLVTINSRLHNIKAPHFVIYTKQQLEKKYGPRLVEQGGLQIRTSIDLELQETIQGIVQEELTKIAHLRVGNAAVLVMDPSTGEILAMVGSRDYFDEESDGNVNIVTSLQQPGSSIKVVNYAAALQNGFSAATIINDSPITFNQPNGKPYSPVNYDGAFHGYVTLRTALANSYNVPAVKTLNKIGVDKMLDQGKLMGIDSWEDNSRYGLSLTLGGGEVTLLDMAEAYGTLANSGIRNDSNPVLEVVDFKGEEIDSFTEDSGVKVLPSEVAFILTDILADNSARSRAFGQNSQLYIPDKYVAVKTGTSNNKRDNWTIGYTQDFVVVVWVGNNDNSPMHPTLTSGITGATPIWRKVMDHLLQDREALPLPVPEGLVKIPCFGKHEYFVRGTEPKRGCGSWPKPTGQITPTPTPS